MTTVPLICIDRHRLTIKSERASPPLGGSGSRHPFLHHPPAAHSSIQYAGRPGAQQALKQMGFERFDEFEYNFFLCKYRTKE
ncbi:hypothetical protein [Prevotella sp.]|uniref:hypothetical protein n=1 Tax=Prevotella sp. TaxID=59823 RepID=UPI0025D300B4|nr:hypothetical protein [Prevotella sp.]